MHSRAGWTLDALNKNVLLGGGERGEGADVAFEQRQTGNTYIHVQHGSSQGTQETTTYMMGREGGLDMDEQR